MLQGVEPWMKQPGARVRGQRARVGNEPSAARPRCECGYPFVPLPTMEGGCLAVVQHLLAAVRDGAEVVPDDDGLAGVREPRRPKGPLGSISTEADPD